MIGVRRVSSMPLSRRRPQWRDRLPLARVPGLLAAPLVPVGVA
jgi:hypothetical protein